MKLYKLLCAEWQTMWSKTIQATGSLLLVPFAMFLLQATGGNWRITWAALGLIILVLAVPLEVDE